MNTENNKIQYKQVIALGFKRKDLGGGSVFFDEHGYDWFIASKTLVKEQGCKIVANWHPETKDIEVLYLDKKRSVISRQCFSGQHGLARYRAIQLFFCPKQKPVGYHNQKEEGFSKQTEASHTVTAKQAAERLQDFATQIKQAN